MEATLIKNQDAPPRRGEWVSQIPGGYRSIKTHQLVMAWWMMRAGHISKRQLRIYFAAHEMHQRREYTQQDPGTGQRRRPSYGLDEIVRLIGCSDSKTALAALSADVKQLGKLGLVKIMASRIEFAVSIDEIALDDVSGFWELFDQIKNKGRTIPMPRRTCRALAAGFSKAVMGTMIGLMIRGLYWHKPRGQKNTDTQAVGEGGSHSAGYRVDGSTTRAWLASFIGVDERSITTARARLIELGWITPDEDQPQWHRNRHGVRDIIQVEAFGPEKQGQTSTPLAENSGQTSSPCLNSSPSSNEEDLNTRRPARERSGPSGFLKNGLSGKASGAGSRKKQASSKPASRGPVLHDIQDADLRDTDRLLELHRQAVAKGIPVAGEAGRLDFIALAERARSCGDSPPRMFAWLLKHRRFDFIAIANEEAASERLREWRYGPRNRQSQWEDEHLRNTPKSQPMQLTEDEKFVLACIKAGRMHKVDPFRIAQTKGWDTGRWEIAKDGYEQKDRQRWG